MSGVCHSPTSSRTNDGAAGARDISPRCRGLPGNTWDPAEFRSGGFGLEKQHGEPSPDGGTAPSRRSVSMTWPSACERPVPPSGVTRWNSKSLGSNVTVTEVSRSVRATPSGQLGNSCPTAADTSNSPEHQRSVAAPGAPGSWHRMPCPFGTAEGLMAGVPPGRSCSSGQSENHCWTPATLSGTAGIPGLRSQMIGSMGCGRWL